jgi:hypothetical protein
MTLNSSSQMTRRTVLGGVAATPLAASLPALAQTKSGLAPLAPANALLERSTAFLARLSPDKKQAASFPWNGKQWKGWDYYGVSGYAKPGLRLEQMSAEEKELAWRIFAEVLSPEGVKKAQNVMLLQESLMEEGDGVGQRSAEKAWGLRLEGHHLSLSFAVLNNQVVSVTPQAFAVRPARVARGKHKGLITIGPEEDIARQLMADFGPERQKKARVADRHLFNILSAAGRERANTAGAGLFGADMSSSQRDLLRELVRVYAVKPYAGALASALEKRADASPIERVSFAWYGGNTPGRAFGYRVIAPGYVIEMGSIDGEGQHLHPVYHDLGNVLGTAA